MTSDAVRTVVSTRSRVEAAEAVARSFPRLRLSVTGDGPFHFRHSVVGNDRLRVYELEISGRSGAEGALPDGLIAAGFLLRGRLSVDYPRHRLDTSRPYRRPTAPAVSRMEDVHVRMLTCDAEAFRVSQERYADVLGAHYRLNRTSPASVAAAGAWRWTADRIVDSVRDDRGLANSIVESELFDLAVRMLLVTFGEPTAQVQQRAELSASPAAVRRAVAYLEEHAAGPVTMPEVAVAARVSLRSLQSQFRRHLGVSPLEHLHQIRLEAARRELLAAADDAASVQQVALRWGFGNSGRFAKHYFDRFHERPSDTLRRS